MKNHKWLWLVTFLLITSLVIISSALGCSSTQTSSTTSTIVSTPPLSTSSLTPAPSSSTPPPVTQATTAPSAKTLKVGIEADMSSTVGLDWIHAVEIMVDQDNKSGGLSIGGGKYQVKLIEYDSGTDQTTETAAVNRLVFQDQVKYILAQGTNEPAWINITEPNKVIVMTSNPIAFLTLTPNFHYSFNGTSENASAAAITAAFVKKYPDLVKNVVVASPDNMFGHSVAQFILASWKAFGVTPNQQYYPAGQQDLSALGTKVVTLNPSVFVAVTGSDAGDGLVLNAVRQAGYKGQFFATTQSPAAVLVQTIQPQALEGLICGALPTEFDPTLTQAAQDFKNAWIAKYGSWTSPNITYAANYSALRTALQQAGSTDTDKVAGVLSNGMKYETPIGSGIMVSRPDLGNSRTVDSVITAYIKQILNGKPSLLETVSVEDGINDLRTAYPPLPPGATPGGGPPPGGPPPQ